MLMIVDDLMITFRILYYIKAKLVCLHVQVGQSDLAREGSVRLTGLAKAASPFHLATTFASLAYHLRNNHERQGLASRLQVVCTYIYRVHSLAT
jgi:hypothetical protein